MQYDTLTEDLLARGYVRGLPVQRLRELMNGTSSQPGMGAEACCEACGNFGLSYHFWLDTGGIHTLKVVSICPACKEAEEW